MRILLYRWKAYSDVYLKENLLQMGYEVNDYTDLELLQVSEPAVDKMCEIIKQGYDLVFSYNYFPGVAEACFREKIPYAAWTQDAPLLSLYSKTIVYATNYIFCFDTYQLEQLVDRGVEHAYYLPLGVDTEIMENIAISNGEEKQRFSSDICFVGDLYRNVMLYNILPKLPAYLQGYLQAIIQAQYSVPVLHFSDCFLDKEGKDKLKKYIAFEGEEYRDLPFECLMDNLLDRYVTSMDRRRMIEICGQYIGFHMHTKGTEEQIYGVKNLGEVNYYTEMPKAFYNSKINLNYSLRSIRRGIPLRVLDVIASGGFILTNAQSDLFYHFEEGKSIATFNCLEELKDKIDFYLIHDTVRGKIVEEGIRVVKEQFELRELLLKIINEIYKEI